jgi:hypothetical protein
LGEGLKYFSLTVIINSFPKIVKGILREIPKNDYPVLNSRLFFECWLSYALDIAYLILQIVSIPAQWGYTLLDKFRYLQSCMCQKISYVHWFEEIMFC